MNSESFYSETKQNSEKYLVTVQSTVKTGRVHFILHLIKEYIYQQLLRLYINVINCSHSHSL